MTFTAKLSKMLDIAGSSITMDDLEVDDDMLVVEHRDRYLVANDPRNITIITLDLSSYDYGEYIFYDQDVEVDGDGLFVASDDEGEDFTFRVTMTRPVLESDL